MKGQTIDYRSLTLERLQAKSMARKRRFSEVLERVADGPHLGRKQTFAQAQNL